MEDGKLVAEIRNVVHDFAQKIRRAGTMDAQIAIEDSLVNCIVVSIARAEKREQKKETPKIMEMVCPECKREVEVEMGDDKLGVELLCQECGKHAVTPELLAKAPRLEPKHASDKALMESFRKAEPQ